MALSDTGLKNLKPGEKNYRKADEGGLYVDVSIKGLKTWGLRYRLNDKQERIGLGTYPDYSIAEARVWRDACKVLSGRGLSPMALKRGDPIPNDAPPISRELAEAFIRDWCQKTHAKVKAKQEEVAADNTLEAVARRWYADVVERDNKNPRNIKRALEKDIYPMLGRKQIHEVTKDDILNITDRIKNRGADQMALQTRNILKRLFAYAIGRRGSLIQWNPAAAIEARFIAVAKSRDMALTPDEIGKLLRGIYQSSMKRANKLALHLLILCMVRKSELIEAKWEELDLEAALWSIPAERMKMDRPHLVALSRQAVAMFEELKGLASGSEYVFPSRNDLNQPISKSTLNVVVRSLALDIRDFVIHDFRRTASTHLNEAGFNSDWIEKCLAHETGGVRGIYNRAEYADQRREMLQWWADFVDSQIEEGRKVIIGRFGKAYQAA